MDNNEAREILIKYNRYRRGESNSPMPNPTEAGQAIDCAIQALGDGWVSVEDGLPDPFVNVWVCTNRGQYGKSCVDASGGFDEFICEVYQTDTIDDEKIVYWQPINAPKPKQP